MSEVLGNDGQLLSFFHRSSMTKFESNLFGCGSKPTVPFWGRWTTHLRAHFSGDWDVHWGYDLGFDPWPFRKLSFPKCPRNHPQVLEVARNPNATFLKARWWNGPGGFAWTLFRVRKNFPFQRRWFNFVVLNSFGYCLCLAPWTPYLSFCSEFHFVWFAFCSADSLFTSFTDLGIVELCSAFLCVFWGLVGFTPHYQKSVALEHLSHRP